MEAISLDLQPEQSPRMLLLHRGSYALLSFLSIVQCVVQEGGFRYFNLAFGLVFLGLTVFHRRIFAPKALVFDETGIEGPLGGHRKARLNWIDISRIDETMYALTFIMKTGEKRTADLSAITFTQHKQIKPKIFALAASKGVEVRTA